MEFLQLIASTTQRGLIVSQFITDRIQMQALAHGDLIDGKITVVYETGDPTAPTAAYTFDNCTGIAITDGKDIIYAQATAIQVAGNMITFELLVDNAELQAALLATTDDFIEAFFEVRVAANSSPSGPEIRDAVVLREPMTINSIAGTSGAIAPATTYTLSGPIGGSMEVESGAFTVALPSQTSVTGSVTITPNDGGAGGAFMPASVQLTTQAPSAMFTYTPIAAGTATISTTNSQTLTDPVSVSYIATPLQHLLNMLQSYWKLDEASGTRADSHGSNDLITGTVGSAPGLINNAAVFVGASHETLSTAINPPGLSINASFGFSLWFKVASITSYNVIATKYNNNGPNDQLEWDFYIDNTGLYFDVFNPVDGSAATAYYPSTFGNTWHHAVCWFDYSTGLVYIRVDDTTTVQSPSALPSLPTGTGQAPFMLGGYYDFTGNEFDGDIDEVGFWKGRIPTPSEITALFNNGAGLPYILFSP